MISCDEPNNHPQYDHKWVAILNHPQMLPWFLGESHTTQRRSLTKIQLSSGQLRSELDHGRRNRPWSAWWDPRREPRYRPRSRWNPPSSSLHKWSAPPVGKRTGRKVWQQDGTSMIFPSYFNVLQVSNSSIYLGCAFKIFQNVPCK